MNHLQFSMWCLALLILVLPWCVATMLTWISSEAFAVASPNSNNELDLTGSRIVSIAQTCSCLVYVLYIFFALTWIGFAGRRSLCSYCCLVVGIPTFATIPIAAGCTLLLSVLDSSRSQVGVDIGIAAAVSCLLSTLFCMVITCWALMCGSCGRGKNHQYPIPLAYLPFLRDFTKDASEKEVRDSERYTADYPPPLSSFSDKKIDNSAFLPTINGDRVSMVSSQPKAAYVKTSKQETPGHKGSVCSFSSSSYTVDRRSSTLSTNTFSGSSQKLSKQGAPGRKISKQEAPGHKGSVCSFASSSYTADRRSSTLSTNTLSGSSQKLSKREALGRKMSKQEAPGRKLSKKESTDPKVSWAGLACEKPTVTSAGPIGQRFSTSSVPNSYSTDHHRPSALSTGTKKDQI